MTDAKAESADEKAFNETLKRMLKTPPKPRDNSKASPDYSEADEKDEPNERAKPP